jgi:hypothetical protein
MNSGKFSFLGGFFGALLLFLPTAASAEEDLFSVATHALGADRYTEVVFGFNNAVGSTEESVWDIDDLPTAGDGPVRCFANMNSGTTPTAANLYISSDDENDGADNNAVSVTVEALDANWDPVTIVAPLGDASASGTVFAQIGSATLMRVNRAYVTTAAPAGNIYIGKDDADGGTDGVPDTIATDAVAGITIGANETRQACYSVPNDYNAFLTHWCVSDLGENGTAATIFRIRESVNGAAARVKTRLALAEGDERCHVVSPPMQFSELTDIEFTGTSTADDAAANFGLVLISTNRSGLNQ